MFNGLGQDRGECGAAAVEFALVVPMLLVLLLGIVEFSRAYHAQSAVSAAAREGARAMAIQDDVDAALEHTVAAAPTLQPTLTASHVEVSLASCAPGQTVAVTVSYPFSFVTDAFGDGLTLTGHGVMRCGG